MQESDSRLVNTPKRTEGEHAESESEARPSRDQLWTLSGTDLGRGVGGLRSWRASGRASRTIARYSNIVPPPVTWVCASRMKDGVLVSRNVFVLDADRADD